MGCGRTPCASQSFSVASQDPNRYAPRSASEGHWIVVFEVQLLVKGNDDSQGKFIHHMKKLSGYCTVQYNAYTT